MSRSIIKQLFLGVALLTIFTSSFAFVSRALGDVLNFVTYMDVSPCEKYSLVCRALDDPKFKVFDDYHPIIKYFCIKQSMFDRFLFEQKSPQVRKDFFNRFIDDIQVRFQTTNNCEEEPQSLINDFVESFGVGIGTMTLGFCVWSSYLLGG